MVIPKIAICPICGAKIYLRIQDGAYIKKYPIRVHCGNCRALIKGEYTMFYTAGIDGLKLFNADIEECDVEKETETIRNADYVMEISGELPSRRITVFDGKMIKDSPFLYASRQMDIMKWQENLTLLARSFSAWEKRQSIAFNLLQEGSFEYIPKAINHKIGRYDYVCDNDLKTLHCLQEIVHNETTNLFLDNTSENDIGNLIEVLSKIERNSLKELVLQIGNVNFLMDIYGKIINIFSDFMDIYPNVLPAITYSKYRDKSDENLGISTCSFSDIKTFYQDAYETLLSLWYIPVCMDNILLRGNYTSFNSEFEEIFEKRQYANFENSFVKYLHINNGKRLEKNQNNEPIQRILSIPANKDLRNGIGHNNVKYDGIEQIISILDKNKSVTKVKMSLNDMALDCVGLTRTAVLLAEIVLFLLREVLREEGIKSIINPDIYRNTLPNEKCPCGSNIKYKKCCRSDVKKVVLSNSR